MLDLDTLKTEFARSIMDSQGRKWGLDSALMHVCTLAYNQGAADAGAPKEGAQGTFIRTGGPRGEEP